ncbi:MAG TPA: BTAD domain-containing putative transcriptional regulator, partial [Propionibacteriaceae bacterium]|nr:BTAD domain-containing putative transcriptional regulator [Propionibacteriaceae bacterium]
MVQIALLGPLEVELSGRRVKVPSGKPSELLVRLALDAGEIVRADRLIDELWAADALSTRRNTLQSKVAMLRRALGEPDLIVNSDGGYALVVEPSEVDALAAMARVAAASRLLDAGDDRAAAELSASTLGLFRGEVLQAAGDGDWVDPHKARLEETRTKLLEIHFSARLRLGDAGNVIGELEAAVAAHPFHEGLWELLITALYRAGRQADALATYQRIRNQLADELGLDPRPQLQQLEQLILAQDASLGAQVSGIGALPDFPEGNLPSMSADLVGRGDVVADLCDLLAAERLVEIVGSGGVGKTAVAIEVGRRLNSMGKLRIDGVWLARLETATTANEVVDVLIAALNVPGGELALLERLKGTAPLVILDNCEHVVDSAAALAVRLLDAAPGLRILCTSQVRLGVDGEALVELAPLPLSDAVALFTRLAGAQRPSYGSSMDVDAVLDVCHSLDGLPLAIELAAARTKTLSIEEIIRRLDDRFPVLSDPTSRR